MTDPAATPLAPTRTALKPLKECNTLSDAFASGEFMDRLKQGLPTHLNPNAMLRTYIQAVGRTPLLLKVDVRQAIGAFLTLSQLGLMPNNALGEAYLIPFARKKWNPATRTRDVIGYDLNVVIGYKGYLNLAFRSGLVGAVHADVVYDGDEFLYQYGTEQHLKHRPTGKHADAATPAYAYAVAHLTGTAAGMPPFRVLPWSEILRTRAGSQGYQTALYAKEEAEKKNWKLPAAYTEAPWVKHVIPMAMKTAFLRLSTWIPRSLEMVGASAIDEAGDRGARVDFGAVLDGGSIIDQTVDIQEPEPEADSAFGLRPEQEPPEQASTPAPAAPTTPAAAVPTRTPTPARAAFDAYLCDQHGEIAEHGENGHFTDPVKWAEAYAALHAAATDRAILAENNDESMAAIYQHHPAAAAVLDALRQATPAPGITEPVSLQSMVLPVPMKGSRMDLMGYVAAVRTALAALAPEDVEAWSVANARIYADLPPVTRRAVHAAVLEHMPQRAAQQPQPVAQAPQAAVEPQHQPQQPQQPQEPHQAAQPAAAPPAPPLAPEPQEPTHTAEPPADEPPTDWSGDPGPGEYPGPDDAPAAPPARDADEVWTDQLIQDINATKNLHELQTLARNPAIVAKRRMLGTNRPDLLARIAAAGDAKAASF